MVMRPTENNAIAAERAAVRAVPIPVFLNILRRVVKKFCALTRNAAACGGYNVPLVSRATRWSHGSKNVQHLPPLRETLQAPVFRETLELDELWSFVLRKVNQVWVWIALCRRTRQVVAYALGDRSQHTGQRFGEAIP